jgi:mono/diheme cytochrome c family protein
MIIPGLFLIAALWLPVQVTIVPGDSTRGAALFVEKGCIQCHSFNGKGGSVAPDLARPSDESHSPSKLAAELWNHSPMMWAKLSAEARVVPLMNSIDTADLFAYFYSLELSSGNPSRGLNLFERDCENCHTFGAAQPKKVDLLSRRAPKTAAAYTASIRNHKAAGTLPKLMENEIRDLTSYLFAQRYFSEPGDATRGAQIFMNKGCGSCHETKPLGKSAPELAQATERFSPITITSILWRSGPAMLAAMQQKKMAWPEFHGSEMTDLIAYLNQSLVPRIGQ